MNRALEAAARLLATLPVTTVQRIRPELRQGKTSKIMVRGVEYASFNAARKALRVGQKKMQGWLDSGRATIVDEETI